MQLYLENIQILVFLMYPNVHPDAFLSDSKVSVSVDTFIKYTYPYPHTLKTDPFGVPVHLKSIHVHGYFRWMFLNMHTFVLNIKYGTFKFNM